MGVSCCLKIVNWSTRWQVGFPYFAFHLCSAEDFDGGSWTEWRKSHREKGLRCFVFNFILLSLKFLMRNRICGHPGEEEERPFTFQIMWDFIFFMHVYIYKRWRIEL